MRNRGRAFDGLQEQAEFVRVTKPRGQIKNTGTSQLSGLSMIQIIAVVALIVVVIFL